MKSPCHNATVIDRPFGSDLPEGARICSAEGCERVFLRGEPIFQAIQPTPSFIEPKEVEAEQPKNQISNGYEVGLDRELFPELHEQ